jgi:hypothetical protein
VFHLFSRKICVSSDPPLVVPKRLHGSKTPARTISKSEVTPNPSASALLPTELWLRIFGFVSQSTLATASCVCKSWSSVLAQELYTSISIRTFEESKLLLRTLNGHPERGKRVRELTLPLQLRRGSDSQRPQAKRFYLLYADIILLCPNLDYLNTPTYARELCFSLPLSIQHLPNLSSLKLRNARQRLTWKSCLLGQCLGRASDEGKPSVFSLRIKELELEGYDIQSSLSEPNGICWNSSWSLNSLTLQSCDVSHEELIDLLRSCRTSLRTFRLLFCCGLQSGTLPLAMSMLSHTLHAFSMAGGTIWGVQEAIGNLQVLESISVDESVAKPDIFRALPQSVRKITFTHLRPSTEPSFMRNTAQALLTVNPTSVEQIETLAVQGRLHPNDSSKIAETWGTFSSL